MNKSSQQVEDGGGADGGEARLTEQRSLSPRGIIIASITPLLRAV